MNPVEESVSFTVMICTTTAHTMKSHATDLEMQLVQNHPLETLVEIFTDDIWSPGFTSQ